MGEKGGSFGSQQFLISGKMLKIYVLITTFVDGITMVTTVTTVTTVTMITIVTTLTILTYLGSIPRYYAGITNTAPIILPLTLVHVTSVGTATFELVSVAQCT